MHIRDALESRHVWFQHLLHRPEPCASRFAESLHEPGDRVAKSVLVRVGDTFILAVLPATRRVDLGLLSELNGGQVVRLATEAEIERVFQDCERGAVPPFGRSYGLTTLLDASLASCESFVFVGNQRHEAYRLRVSDFERIEAPTVLRFAATTAAPADHRPRRRAG
ncbi:MAG: YbaK/EbsC family protein [Isosphaeraceae bacterium]